MKREVTIDVPVDDWMFVRWESENGLLLICDVEGGEVCTGADQIEPLIAALRKLLEESGK